MRLKRVQLACLLASIYGLRPCLQLPATFQLLLGKVISKLLRRQPPHFASLSGVFSFHIFFLRATRPTFSGASYPHLRSPSLPSLPSIRFEAIGLDTWTLEPPALVNFCCGSFSNNAFSLTDTRTDTSPQSLELDQYREHLWR